MFMQLFGNMSVLYLSTALFCWKKCQNLFLNLSSTWMQEVLGRTAAKGSGNAIPCFPPQEKCFLYHSAKWKQAHNHILGTDVGQNIYICSKVQMWVIRKHKMAATVIQDFNFKCCYLLTVTISTHTSREQKLWDLPRALSNYECFWKPPHPDFSSELSDFSYRD